MGVSPSPQGTLGPWFFLRSFKCRLVMRAWCSLIYATASKLAAVKWPISRLAPMYLPYDMAVAKISGVANSFGSGRLEWPCPPKMILYFSGNGATRLGTLTCVVEEVALTPRGLAMWNG